MEKSGFSRMSLYVTMSRNTCRPRYVSKRAAFESSEPLHLLRLNGHLRAIPR